MPTDLTTCPGCGADLPVEDGPTHAYMTSSPACFALYTAILSAEYSDPALMPIHRLSVDTFAVQHPGDGSERRMIQSVGLHLARLLVQLENPMGPRETNDVMLTLGPHKLSLIWLDPPKRFSVTTADVAPFAGTPRHAGKVIEWARETWSDWSDHHSYIRNWTARHLHP